MGEVQRFVAGTRNQTAEQIQRLGNLTQVLVDHRLAFENVLHITPNAIANFENIYYPNGGSVTGAFSFVNFSNPVQAICGMIGAVENTTAPETAKLCAQYLGPALRLLNFNGLGLPINPYLRPAINPDRIIYTDPKLAPGGAGPGDAPEPPPTVSAYTGEGDIPPPPGWNGPPNTYQGIYAPPLGNDAPSNPSTAVINHAPALVPPHIISNVPATSPSVDGMLAPEGQALPPDPNAPLLPAEGAPPS